jgi:hypothetical protein
MNGSWERSGAGNRHAGCSGTTPLGESIWKFRARTASLHFDHTVLAELIARRWKEDARICLGRVPGGGLSDSFRSTCRQIGLSESRSVPATQCRHRDLDRLD